MDNDMRALMEDKAELTLLKMVMASIEAYEDKRVKMVDGSFNPKTKTVTAIIDVPLEPLNERIIKDILSPFLIDFEVRR